MSKNLKKPFISVLMPVYNGEKYLRESIDSILNQTYQDFELLLINDASSDSTESIILSYQDKRIAYIKNEQNLGLIKTLNKGLDLAKGDFIARMDQDDIANPERFAKQVVVFERNPEIGVCGTWFTCFRDDLPQKMVQHHQENERLKIDLLTLCVIGHPTVMLRKKAIAGYRYDENFQAAEDYELWSRLIKVTQFYNIPESLLQYRLHHSSMSVLESTMQAKNTRKIIGNQLKNIGIEDNDINIELCQTLFGALFKSHLTDDEFRKLTIFANDLEYHNQKKKFYNSKKLHMVINEKLSEAFKRTIYRKISILQFLLKNRKEIIFQRSILDNTKMLVKMILKK